MDKLKNINEGLYLRETFRVLGADQAWHSANLCRVARPGGPFPPSPVYLGLMIERAVEHGFPADCVDGLKALSR